MGVECECFSLLLTLRGVRLGARGDAAGRPKESEKALGFPLPVVHEPRAAIPLQGTWIGSASDYLAMKVAVKVVAA